MAKGDTVRTRSPDTRDDLIKAARKQFAAYGFYGASIAKIADELGLTKQALLYHFSRKEDLYAEVLKSISDRFLTLVQDIKNSPGTPNAKLERLFMTLYDMGRDHPRDRLIVTRELLDNKARADKVKTWYLVDFMNEITDLMIQVRRDGSLPVPVARALTYQLLGSIDYFLVSEETLRRMYGTEDYDDMKSVYPDQLRDQIRRTLAAAG